MLPSVLYLLALLSSNAQQIKSGVNKSTSLYVVIELMKMASLTNYGVKDLAHLK
jgi:hypothetical protein